jgi:hypothetical protein
MCDRVRELRKGWINAIIEECLDEEDTIEEACSALQDLSDLMETTASQRSIVAALGALEVYLYHDVATANLLSTFSLRLRQMARERKS